MKTYTPQEVLTMIRNNPDLYTKIALKYPCNNLPIIENCDKCDKPKSCPINNKPS